MYKVHHSTIVELSIIGEEFFQEYIIPLIGPTNNNPDYFELKIESKQSIGIKETRDLISWLQFKPFQASCKIALIMEADKLTTEAQNSLLKTLEEPPKNTFIFLITPNHKSLLPTIISRSQLLRLNNELQEKITSNYESLEKLLSSKPDIKFKWIDKIYETKNHAERKQIIENFLKKLYVYTKRDEETTKALTNLKLIEKTFEGLRRNVNIKLLLENLLLNYKH